MTKPKLNLLPMLGHTRGKRSAVTCALKCDNACAKAVCNESDNGYFRDIASATFSRRSALGFGGAGILSLAAVALAACAPPSEAGAGTRASKGTGAKGLAFDAIQPVDLTVDAFNVPTGYSWSPIIRWGDPLFADSPDFDLANQSAAAQARQFGYNNDYLEILRSGNGKNALLVCNHEYVNPAIMFPSVASDAEALERRRIAMAAHGMAVVELERGNTGKPWKYIQGGKRNRRITAHTAFELTGPLAGSSYVKTTADPGGHTVLGTVGNCSGGSTPWGTILSGEENFNGYFRCAATSAAEKRYGFTDKATTTGWETLEPRWDARTPGYENEINRFGYIVEIDPDNPESTPVKHTALGRLKHEGANVIVAGNGHVAAYMGDDEKFDYLYKFVSQDTYRKDDKQHNMTLLTAGNLYVARFTGDSPATEIDGTGKLPADGAFHGSGEWLPLVVDGKSAIDAMTLEEVLVHTRLAADKAGATKMDRCEDVQPHPVTGRVYVACTNNSDRGKPGKAASDETNPRSLNRDGHIVEITETADDATATTFKWSLLMVCGDPAKNESAYFAGYPQDKVSPISCPDNVAFDAAGNLWISTDGAPSAIGYNDGLFKVMLEGTERGRVQQFLSVPRDAETCGPVVHDDEGMVYVAVQHPGEEGTFEDQHSYFPDYGLFAFEHG
ncbi:PhoX family protein [Arthrobacter sp. A5]|uniref:PhoX family protein n=1 Tax=Arthrobacter sp. A5 TaxID=576926 RepID=UPI003DA7FA82